MAQRNDLAFVRSTMAVLETAGIKTWLFGGWAEEVLGLTAPREHHDVDLLYPAGDFRPVDTLIASDRDLSEIETKRFPHKRAFLRAGIMIELILVPEPGGRCITTFWGSTWLWPDDLLRFRVSGLPVASAASVRDYRAGHDRITGTA